MRKIEVEQIFENTSLLVYSRRTYWLRHFASIFCCIRRMNADAEDYCVGTLTSLMVVFSKAQNECAVTVFYHREFRHILIQICPLLILSRTFFIAPRFQLGTDRQIREAEFVYLRHESVSVAS